MTNAQLDTSRERSLRLSAAGGLGFTLLYVVHVLLQGLGPDKTAAAAITAYEVKHRTVLLASEVAVRLALLVFLAFLAPLVATVWRVGSPTFAVAVLAAGVVFLAMGFLSSAAETALVGVAGDNEPGAVLALDELQGRTPVVWTITALVSVLSLTVLSTGLLSRWVGIAGLVAAAVFLLGSLFSVFGRTAEGSSSLYGVGVFVVWMLVFSIALWRPPKATTGATPA
jgi:hypothetical protein